MAATRSPQAVFATTRRRSAPRTWRRSSPTTATTPSSSPPACSAARTASARPSPSSSARSAGHLGPQDHHLRGRHPVPGVGRRGRRQRIHAGCDPAGLAVPANGATARFPRSSWPTASPLPSRRCSSTTSRRRSPPGGWGRWCSTTATSAPATASRARRSTRGRRSATTGMRSPTRPTRPEVAGDRIGVWGTSYSGGHVLVLGAIDKRIKCVVAQVPLVSGFRNIQRLVRQDFWPPTARRSTRTAPPATAASRPPWSRWWTRTRWPSRRCRPRLLGVVQRGR